MQLHGDATQTADLHLLFVQDGAPQGAPSLGADFGALLNRVAQETKGDKLSVLHWTERDYALAPLPEDPASARKLGVHLARTARDLGAASARVGELPAPLAFELALGAGLGAYRFTRFKADDKPALESLAVGGLSESDARRAFALLEGVALARDLVNLPFNALNARDLARIAREMAARHGLDFTVWDRTECELRGLGLFLAVAAGSAHEPQFIQLRYRPENPKRVVALVGKGVMFDTGGYSLKTAQGMLTMKGDMGGAAAVLGAMQAVARLAPDVEVRAYVAACDNAVSDRAMRPGDVFRGANGKTVEVTNTDAEGRLTLADALAVADDEAPHAIIDLATLTGAKVTALGDDVAALFANDDALAREIQDAAKRAGEFVWQLPLHAPYLKSYKKGPADLKNSDLKPAGGSIKAALFMSEFVTRPWAHLDIAGNALSEAEHDGGPAGGTGFGVLTLVELLAPRRQD